jgi:DNA-binding MarR family transcriptional regulator/GNAT superfamily N-acetyltransferase
MYTTRLGLLCKGYLDGSFSLTEARILFEIGVARGVTAARLCMVLELDRGYISRTLAALSRRRLVRQAASKKDAREKLLSLTAVGAKVLARIDAQSSQQVEEWLMPLDVADRDAIVASLERVQEILARPQLRIVRLTRENEDARRILAEYYEAVSVIQRDSPGAIQSILNERGSGMWLALLGEETVGCVVLRRLGSIAGASECKRLYVVPSARGRGIAEALLDAQEDYCREQGVQWIYLDSYDGLKAAIALYRKRRYKDCKRYNDNPQATVFMRKRLR